MLISADTALRVFESDMVEPSYSIKCPLQMFNCSVFLKDSRKLIVGGNSDSLYEIDIYNKKIRACVLEDCSCVKAICLNKKQNLIAVGAKNGLVYFVSYPELNVVGRSSKYKFSIVGISFLKQEEESVVVAGDTAGHLVKFGPFSQPKDYSKLTTKNGPINSLTTLLSGDLAVSAAKSLYVYDMYTEEVSSIYDVGATSIVVASPTNENEILIATQFGRLELYNVKSDSVINTVEVGNGVTAVAMNPNGNTVAAAYFGGADLVDMDSADSLVHLSISGNHLTTMLIFQPEIIAIPEDAVFSLEDGQSTQIWCSKAQLSRSRTGNSMKIINEDFAEEEDYSKDKFAFKRSLQEINTDSHNMSAGGQCISRHGIRIGSPSKRVLNDSTHDVSGVMSFTKSGSPSIEHRTLPNLSTIVAPEIASFPSPQKNNASEISTSPKSPSTPNQSPLSSPRMSIDTNQTDRDVTEIREKSPRLTPTKQSSLVRFDENQLKDIEDSRHSGSQLPVDEEIHEKSDVIDAEPIVGHSTSFNSLSEDIWKRIGDMNTRIQKLEDRYPDDTI